MKFNSKSLFMSLALAASFFMVSCGNENSTETATENTENLVASPEQTNNPTDASTEPTGPTTTMVFENGQVHDYGTIEAGVKVTHKFKFKNTGSEPLIISNCKGSCGCTVPVCPTSPIAPGETGEIPVEFDSKGKNGPDTKTVTITANTNPTQTILTIKGEVKGDPQVITQ